MEHFGKMERMENWKMGLFFRKMGNMEIEKWKKWKFWKHGKPI